MATVTKRIAKSAKRTADGRPLPRVWLEQMAKSYDPAKYTAKLNIEHYISSYPDGVFSEHGDVIKLSTEPADNGELYLLATMTTSQDLDAMWEAGKKRAFSVEVDPDFADVGGAYLVGLAVTSSPSSLGTHFSKDTATESSAFKYKYTDQDLTPMSTENNDSTPPNPAPAATPAQAPTPATVESFSQFNKSLEYFGAELARKQTENAALQAELAKERAEFKTQLAAKDQEFATQLAANAQEFATQLAAKDAEIASLKDQIPAPPGYFNKKPVVPSTTPSQPAFIG